MSEKPEFVHDEDCPCFGDFTANGEPIEHSRDCRNCTCQPTAPAPAEPPEESCPVHDGAMTYDPDTKRWVCLDCIGDAMLAVDHEVKAEGAREQIGCERVSKEAQDLRNAAYDRVLAHVKERIAYWQGFSDEQQVHELELLERRIEALKEEK